MLFHDIGKGHGDGHSERGARHGPSSRRAPAAQRGRRRAVRVPGAPPPLDVAPGAAPRHSTTTASSSSSPGTVGSVENLKMLYVMTFADMRAVGSEGVEQLARHAARRALHADARALRAGRARRGGARRPGRAHPAAPAPRARRSRSAARRVRRLSSRRMPERYFLTTPEEQLPAPRRAMNTCASIRDGGRRAPRRRSIRHFPESRVQRVHRSAPPIGPASSR